MRAWLALPLVILGTVGCRRLDCNDGGPLAAARADGSQAATTLNSSEYRRGLQAGAALTGDDGARDGYQDGYRAGRQAGYDRAYPRGHQDGWQGASADPNACALGASDGQGAGSSAGESDGYSAGWSDGHAAGTQDGAAACPPEQRLRPQAESPAPATQVDPEQSKACYWQGYQNALEPGAYQRGEAEGKRANRAYQDGYLRGDASGRTDGDAAGAQEGYDAGFSAGLVEGTQDKSAALYDPCYQSGYSDGYSNGYSAGYARGHEAGWYAGYDDATAACQ